MSKLHGFELVATAVAAGWFSVAVGAGIFWVASKLFRRRR